jgi:hypothetical protein
MNNQSNSLPIQDSKPICCGKSICDIQVSYVDGRMNQRFRPTKQIQKQIEAVFNQLHDEGYEWLEAFTDGEEVFVRGLGADSVAEVKNDLDVSLMSKIWTSVVVNMDAEYLDWQAF